MRLIVFLVLVLAVLAAAQEDGESSDNPCHKDQTAEELGVLVMQTVMGLKLRQAVDRFSILRKILRDSADNARLLRHADPTLLPRLKQSDDGLARFQWSMKELEESAREVAVTSAFRECFWPMHDKVIADLKEARHYAQLFME